MSIKKLLKENILKHEENRKNFVTEINNVFEGTKIHNNDHKQVYNSLII